MPHTWLADWGDMVRSLCNVAGEKEPDRDRIQVDMDIYRAVATGFLRSARNVTRRELELLVDSVEVVALELGMRFLTDYLRGDSYFKLGPADPPDLNKIRGLGQLALFERLRAAARRGAGLRRGAAPAVRRHRPGGGPGVRQLKIGTASVRGVVGEALTPELIASFACAFGTWCDGRAVVIGRDTRGSSAMLRAAVTAGPGRHRLRGDRPGPVAAPRWSRSPCASWAPTAGCRSPAATTTPSGTP